MKGRDGYVKNIAAWSAAPTFKSAFPVKRMKMLEGRVPRGRSREVEPLSSQSSALH